MSSWKRNTLCIPGTVLHQQLEERISKNSFRLNVRKLKNKRVSLMKFEFMTAQKIFYYISFKRLLELEKEVFEVRILVSQDTMASLIRMAISDKMVFDHIDSLTKLLD